MPAPSEPTPAVQVVAVSKRFGGVVALDGASLSIMQGEIFAIVGENGAGKSTLMKILSGAQRPDSGEVRMFGKLLLEHSPDEARLLGASIVYQELSLFPDRSVLANLFPNRQPTRMGLVSNTEMAARSRNVFERVGLRVDPDTRVRALTLGQRQLVELCRVLLQEPRLVILDEPNSALSGQETETLFSVLRELRDTGITIVYVSHRLEEVFAIADRVAVIRNGRDVLMAPTRDLTVRRVVEAMVGRRQGDVFPPRVTPKAAPGQGLVVRGLTAGRWLRELSLDVRPGEIVGIAGLEGSGVETVFEVLFGLIRPISGSAIYPDGGGLPRDAGEAVRRHICLVPPDRRRQGLMIRRDLAMNMAHVVVGALSSAGKWWRPGELAAIATRQISRLRIKATSAATIVDELSGGNQQKVVVGKWLEVAPRLVLLDDPTRGIDVGAKAEIYELMRELAADDRVLLVTSSELPELIGLCDRIVVLRRGRASVELQAAGLDTTTLLHAVNAPLEDDIAAGSAA